MIKMQKAKKSVPSKSLRFFCIKEPGRSFCETQDSWDPHPKTQIQGLWDRAH